MNPAVHTATLADRVLRALEAFENIEGVREPFLHQNLTRPVGTVSRPAQQEMPCVERKLRFHCGHQAQIAFARRIAVPLNVDCARDTSYPIELRFGSGVHDDAGVRLR